MMKLIFISLCTNGIMKDQYIEYSKCLSTKCELYCITNDNISNEDLHAVSTLNLEYKRKKPWTYFSLIKKNKIIKFINRINPDFIFIFTPHPVNIFLHNFLKKYKVAFWVHDPIPHSGTKLLDKIIIKKQLSIYYSQSCILFVAGEKLKLDILSKNEKLKDKIIVVPFAFISNIKTERIIKAKNIDILFFGRIEYYKGLDILSESLKTCKSNPRVFIVGKGNMQEAYNKKLTFNNTKIINEYVADDKLAELLLQSKIVVLPYRDATGTVTIAQAFYYNVPVIATRVGVFPEYVSNGGYLVEPNNIDELANAIDYMMIEKNREVYVSNISKIYKEKFEINGVIEKIYNALQDKI